jgi:hypothetical protein
MIGSSLASVPVVPTGGLERSGRVPEEVASGVASAFLLQLVKAMRATVPKGPYSGSRGQEVFEGVMDRQMADHLSNELGFGRKIGDWLEARWEGRVGPAPR